MEYKPMLPEPAAQLPGGRAWRYQLKLDGFRTLAEIANGRATLWSREGHDVTHLYPAVVAELAQAVKRNCVLDGELASIDTEGRPSLGALQRREGFLAFYAFDVLEVGGTPIVDQPLRTRARTLRGLIKKARRVQLVDWFDDGPALWDVVIANELEGVVAKRWDSWYVGGRSALWLKVKVWQTRPFVVAGYTQSSAKSLTSLVLATAQNGQFVLAGRCRSGFGYREATELLGRLRPLEQTRPQIDMPPRSVLGANVHWVLPEVICMISFTDTTDTGMLRDAVFKRLA